MSRPKIVKYKRNGVKFRFIKDYGVVHRSIDSWIQHVDNNNGWNRSRTKFARKVENGLE